MKRVLLVLAFVLCAWPASAQYTAKKFKAIEIADGTGQAHVVVVFSGPGIKDATRDYYPSDAQVLYRAVAADFADLNAKRNVISVKELQVGADVPDPAAVAPPTSDDVAVSAFQALAQTWLAAQAKLTVGRATQGAVDAALAALQSAYDKAPATAIMRFDQTLIAAVRPPR